MQKLEQEKIELDSTFVRTLVELNTMGTDSATQYLEQAKQQIAEEAVLNYKKTLAMQTQANKARKQNVKRKISITGAIVLFSLCIVFVYNANNSYWTGIDKKATQMGLKQVNVLSNWTSVDNAQYIEYRNIKTHEPELFSHGWQISMEIKSAKSIPVNEYIPVSVTLYKHGLDVVETQSIHVKGPLPANTTATINVDANADLQNTYYASLDQ